MVWLFKWNRFQYLPRALFIMLHREVLKFESWFGRLSTDLSADSIDRQHLLPDYTWFWIPKVYRYSDESQLSSIRSFLRYWLLRGLVKSNSWVGGIYLLSILFKWEWIYEINIYVNGLWNTKWRWSSKLKMSTYVVDKRTTWKNSSPSFFRLFFYLLLKIISLTARIIIISYSIELYCIRFDSISLHSIFSFPIPFVSFHFTPLHSALLDSVPLIPFPILLDSILFYSILSSVLLTLDLGLSITCYYCTRQTE